MSKTDSFLTLDSQLTIVAWTSGVQEIFGYEAAEILGQPVFALVPEDLTDAAKSVLVQVKAEGHVHGFQTERIAKGGQRIKIVADLLAIRNASGDHCATQITVRPA